MLLANCQCEKCLSLLIEYSKSFHFRYRVKKFWTSWTSPLCQKIRRNKRKIVSTSDFRQKSDDWIIWFIQWLHPLWTHFQSPEGSTKLITKVRGHDLNSGWNVNKAMNRIEPFYATNQPWWVNPTPPNLLPSTHLPVGELFDEWSMS